MMKAIRRLTTSIVTSFESMVSHVENHEALVESALREVQETAARAQAQLGRVRRDGAIMAKRLQELTGQIQLWKDRAAKAALIDRNKALECLRRRNRLEAEHKDLSGQIAEHARLDQQLSQDLLVIDEKLGRLKIQKNLLRTRQTRAEALGAIRNDDSRLISELDDIFDRWEFKVSEYEYLAECGAKKTDDLNQEFEQQESEADLSHQLDELLQADSVTKLT